MVRRFMAGAGVTSLRAGDGRHQTPPPVDASVLSRLSHDIRSPLGAVLGFTDLLLDGAGGPLTAEQKRLLGHIRHGGDRILEVLDHYVHQVEAGRVQP